MFEAGTVSEAEEKDQIVHGLLQIDVSERLSILCITLYNFEHKSQRYLEPSA